MLLASPRTPYMTRTLTVGFSNQLAAGVTLVSCSVTAEAGPTKTTVTDPSPGGTLAGSASINSAPVTIATPNGPVLQAPGQAILQAVQAGLISANYVYRFKGVDTNGLTYEADVQQFVLSYVPSP